jgi:hypothetical protein
VLSLLAETNNVKESSKCLYYSDFEYERGVEEKCVEYFYIM